MKGILLALFLLAFLPCVSAQSILGSSMTVRVDGFSTMGRTPDGMVAWELRGKFAEITANITDVRDYQLFLRREKGPLYKIRSYKCRYINALHEIKSSAPVFLESEGIVASGIGYDLFLDSHVLRIRSNVKIDVKRTKLNTADMIVPEKKEK